MTAALDNGVIRVLVDTYGGELQSLKRTDGDTEYLWQGCPDTYQRKAIQIFPYVGRLTDGRYRLDNRTYEMQPHGFIADLEMVCEQEDGVRAAFWRRADEDTMNIYPRRFLYRVEYRLCENTVEITYRIQNQEERDDRTMYFGLGGHPGFFVPLEEGLAFEDYYLEFEEVKEPCRIGMSETCFVQGEDIRWGLERGRIQRLSHSLFDDDAVILRDMSRRVTLKSDRGRRGVTVGYPQMDYLGIWHWPHTDSNYVCIEPWTSLPSRQGVIEDLEAQDHLIRLGAGKWYRNTWSITLW